MRPQTLTAILLAALAGPALATWLPHQDPAPDLPTEPAALPGLPREPQPEPVPVLSEVPLVAHLFGVQDPAPEPTALPNLARSFRASATEPAQEPAPAPAPELATVPLLAELFVANAAAPAPEPAPAALPGQDPDPGVPAPAPGVRHDPRLDPAVRDTRLQLERLNVRLQELERVQTQPRLDRRANVHLDALRELQVRLETPRPVRANVAVPVPDARPEPAPAPGTAPCPPGASTQSGVTVVVERGDVHIHTGAGGTHVTAPGGTSLVAPGAPRPSTGVDDPRAPRGWMHRDGRAPVPTPPVVAPPTSRSRTAAPGAGTWTLGEVDGTEVLDVWTTTIQDTGEIRWALPAVDPETGRFPEATLRLETPGVDPATGPLPGSTYVIWPTAEGGSGSAPTVHYLDPATTPTFDPLLNGTVVLDRYLALDPGSGTPAPDASPRRGLWTTTAETPEDPSAAAGVLTWLATAGEAAPEPDADAVLLELQALIDELGSEVTSLREELRVLHEEVRQAPRRDR